MQRTNALSRLQRLEEILGLLRATDSAKAHELAAQLGVSLRTLMRDLSLLREQGYPIESDSGRGGGVRLHRHYGIGRLMLSYKEVVDLLLSITIIERLGSPILLRNLKSVRNKLALSFPDAYRRNLQQLRKRILVSEAASLSVLESYPKNFTSPVEDRIHEAFFEMRRLTISYRDVDGNKTRREIEIHYLFLNWPVWYAFSWDYLRDAPRHFRIDRIASATVLKPTFRLKNADVFLDEFEHFAQSI